MWAKIQKGGRKAVKVKGCTKPMVSIPQDSAGVSDATNWDGIVIEVEADDLEEFVDDAIDESTFLPNYEDVDEVEEVVEPVEPAVVVQPSAKSVVGANRPGTSAQIPADATTFKNMFNQFWEEKMKEMMSMGNNSQEGKNLVQSPQVRTIKSPSDTTIYAPALNRSKCGKQTDTVMEGGSKPREDIDNNSGCEQVDKTADTNLMISNFIDTLRLEHDQLAELRNKERRLASTCQPEGEETEAQAQMDRAVIEVEEFKASIAKPGTLEQFVSTQPQIVDIGSGVSDDDFFHLTCHIEPSLIHKIEKGEFVELEKLLPKDKLGGKMEENHLELVQRDGGTYLVLMQRDNKIGSFRKWEQAFRAYATIYCGANPQRAKEIWQYITVINTAASSFLWDNVYNYDIT